MEPVTACPQETLAALAPGNKKIAVVSEDDLGETGSLVSQNLRRQCMHYVTYSKRF
jgi:hypothetical protein